MVKNHLKRLTIPRTWNIKRKSVRFAIRPKAGKIQEYSVSLGTFLKELTQVCTTTREVKALLQNKKVKVSGKLRHDVHYPVGLFDVVELTDSKTSFRLIMDDKGRLVATPCKDADTTLYKITDKTTLRKAKTQLNCLNGKNFIVDKDTYATGDAVVVKGDKITKHLKLEPNMNCLLIAGKHAGSLAVVKDIKDNTITVDADGITFDTLRSYAFVVGKSTPEITLRGVSA